MFSLAHGLWKYIFNKTEFHVLILGVDKAGKTVSAPKIFKDEIDNLITSL
jgi:ADP-ribosylation factor related protein 1